MSEKTYYIDSRIRITSSMVDVGGASYPIRNIAGVSVAEADDNQVGGCFFLPMLVALLVAGFALMAGFSDGFSMGKIKFLFYALVVAAVFFGLFLLHVRGIPHELNLETSSGRRTALTSKNQKYLEELKAHIATAISEYR
jgi:hypothetical protein